MEVEGSRWVGEGKIRDELGELPRKKWAAMDGF